MSQQQQWTPKNLLSTASSCWKAITLQTAVKLDVFSCIAAGSTESLALAEKLGADARAVTMLCNALAAMGLLKKEGGLFQNAEPALRYLVKSSPEYIGYIIREVHTDTYIHHTFFKSHTVFICTSSSAQDSIAFPIATII